MKKYIDLTHTILDGMPEWPGCTPVMLKEIVTVQNDGVANHQLNWYSDLKTKCHNL